jgi:hypothetical protein
MPYKKLPHRKWDELRDLWIDNLPYVEFSRTYPEPTLWDLTLPIGDFVTDGKSNEIPYVAGARESVFREAIILLRKFSYCRKAALSAIADGLPTWGVIAEYDACFYGAKAMCYLLGIASLSRDSKLFLDIFSFRENRNGRRKIREYDIISVYNFKERLTHAVLWGIMGRLCRTLLLPEDREDLQKSLRSLNFDKMSHIRNKLIYDGGFWIGKENIHECDLVKKFGDTVIYNAAMSGIAGDKMEHAYFNVVSIISEALLYFMEDIAKLAPSLGCEVDALNNWRSL